MLRNYLNTALNALNRNRVFAAINIFGLAIGMGVHPAAVVRAL